MQVALHRPATISRTDEALPRKGTEQMECMEPKTLMMLALGCVREDGRVKIALDGGIIIVVDSIKQTEPFVGHPFTDDTFFIASEHGTGAKTTFCVSSLLAVERTNGKTFDFT